MTAGAADGNGAPRVGSSPAPGSGAPSTPTRLGRLGVTVIIVIGLLVLAGWIALSALGPELEVRDQHPGREQHHREGEPSGPGRLTTLR